MYGIEVYICSIKEMEQTQLEEGLKLLPKERSDKAKRYMFSDDQKRSVIASLLVEKYVGPGLWRLSPHGKPYKDGNIKFNLSHSGDYVVLAISDVDVGVDIEEIKETEITLIDYVCSEEEKRNIHSNEDFISVWTRKESIVKALGTGLSFDMKKIPALEGENHFDGVKIYTKSQKVENYILSTSSLKQKREVYLTPLPLSSLLSH